MWPFRRRRPAPSGVARIAEPTGDPADYPVLVVSEHRFPEAYAALWAGADEAEQAERAVFRTAMLVPVRDPQFGVADLEVRIDGRLSGYLRPPHLGRVVAVIEEANAEAAEVPAHVEWGPVGPTTRLRLVLP